MLNKILLVTTVATCSFNILNAANISNLDLTIANDGYNNTPDSFMLQLHHNH